MPHNPIPTPPQPEEEINIVYEKVHPDYWRGFDDAVKGEVARIREGVEELVVVRIETQNGPITELVDRQSVLDLVDQKP